MKTKNLWRLFPVFIFMGIIIFFEGKSYKERKNFHSSSINSYIIKKKNNWSGGKSYGYLTENNITITLMNIGFWEITSKDHSLIKFISNKYLESEIL